MGSPKQSARPESKIRDYLAVNLDLIEPGLRLVEKEKFLHNDKGATGFVDLFVRSKTGQLIIIEIKRSDAAARQAIQEIVKYAALVKQNLLIKETEIRLIIMSTEWRELLVPFSEFVRATRFAIEGRRIVLDAKGLPEATETVALAAPELPRRISRRHFIWGFDNETAARAAIPILANYIESVGLTDFVAVLLAIRGSDDENQRFLYFAQQELTLDAYMALIRRRFSKEAIAEFEEYISDLTEEEDKVSEAADKVWEDMSLEDALYTRLGATHAQIAYPEKARIWFDSTTLISQEISRFGRFVDSDLRDEIIVEELIGNGGESFHHGSVVASLGSKPEIDASLRVSDNLFFFNPVWRLAVRDLCEYAQKTGAQSIKLRIFSNEDILRTLAGLAIGYAGYIPGFQFDVVFSNKLETYVGVIEWDGRKIDFNRLIADHFAGDGFQYFMARHFGVNRNQNADLMGDIGLRYNVGRATSEGVTNIRVHGATISDVQGGTHRPLTEFFHENPEFLKALVELFLQHEQEFSQLFAKQAFLAAETSLEALASHPDNEEFWSGHVDNCNLCQRDLSTAKFMIDGPVQGGAWACMCALCFQQARGRIGWGEGQLYQRSAGGWLLVGGGRPH